MELYLEHGGKSLFGNEANDKIKITSNRPNRIIITKGMKIKTDNIEKARKELSRDVYVIQGVLKETDYGLVVE